MSYANPQCMSYLVKRSKERTEELAKYRDYKPTTDERRTWRIMLRAASFQSRDKERGLL